VVYGVVAVLRSSGTYLPLLFGLRLPSATPAVQSARPDRLLALPACGLHRGANPPSIDPVSKSVGPPHCCAHPLDGHAASRVWSRQPIPMLQRCPRQASTSGPPARCNADRRCCPPCSGTFSPHAKPKLRYCPSPHITWDAEHNVLLRPCWAWGSVRRTADRIGGQEPSGGGVVEADAHEGEPAGGVGGALLGAEPAVAAGPGGGGVAGGAVFVGGAVADARVPAGALVPTMSP
jgi:hypothetical protein